MCYFLYFFVLLIFKSSCYDRELYSNDISGRVPEELGNLTNLVSLDLYLNNLTGYIPNTLGRLLKLRFLYAHLSFILWFKSIVYYVFLDLSSLLLLLSVYLYVLAA